MYWAVSYDIKNRFQYMYMYTYTYYSTYGPWTSRYGHLLISSQVWTYQLHVSSSKSGKDISLSHKISLSKEKLTLLQMLNSSYHFIQFHMLIFYLSMGNTCNTFTFDN